MQLAAYSFTFAMSLDSWVGNVSGRTCVRSTFHFSVMCRENFGPTQSPVQWASGSLLSGVNRPSFDLSSVGDTKCRATHPHTSIYGVVLWRIDSFTLTNNSVNKVNVS
jgi:hypothetical protein